MKEVKIKNQIQLDTMIKWIREVDPKFNPDTDKALVELYLVCQLRYNGIEVWGEVKTVNMDNWEEFGDGTTDDTTDLVQELYHNFNGYAYELYEYSPYSRLALSDEIMNHKTIEVQFAIIAGNDT